ncbi:MAG: hypothetical protein WBQ65_15360 [Bryobacteraceae bacterium]
MNEHFFEVLVPAVGLVSGLIGAFVGLQNRALLAEVRKELAELENQIFTRINGTYVRAGECHLREENMRVRLDTIVEAIRNRNAAGD